MPAINNKGVIAFPAVLENAAVLGGIFVAGTRDLRMLLGVGELGPSGAMLVRFSERVAINDDDNVALSAQLRSGNATKEAVLVVTVSGLVEIAAVGDSAPGGGTFAALAHGPASVRATWWPSSLVSTAGLGRWDCMPVGARDLRCVAMVGDRLANGKVLQVSQSTPSPLRDPMVA